MTAIEIAENTQITQKTRITRTKTAEFLRKRTVFITPNQAMKGGDNSSKTALSRKEAGKLAIARWD